MYKLSPVTLLYEAEGRRAAGHKNTELSEDGDIYNKFKELYPLSGGRKTSYDGSADRKYEIYNANGRSQIK